MKLRYNIIAIQASISDLIILFATTYHFYE